MSNSRAILLACTLVRLSVAACISFDQAHKHIGETQCITGKVMRVQAGTGGTHYLDFCDDYRLCSFSVVVFSHDLKNVGDLRQLAGKVVEIRGEVKECDDRAEIILESRKQLSGEFAMLAPMPKSFDVEQRGHFSAGKFRVKKSRTTYKKKGAPNATSRDSGRCGVGVRLPCAVPFGTRLDLFSAFPSTVLGESREESESRRDGTLFVVYTSPFLNSSSR